MRRVRFYEYGGPEVLRVEDAEAPKPGPGELLVRTEAIGVTLPSVRKVRGEDGTTPLLGVLGGEAAGTVIALGSDVTGFEVGDRITSLTFRCGSYSELAIAPGLGVLSLCPPGSRGLAPRLAALPKGPGSSATRTFRRLAMHGTRPRDLIGRS